MTNALHKARRREEPRLGPGMIVRMQDHTGVWQRFGTVEATTDGQDVIVKFVLLQDEPKILAIQ